MLHIDKSLYDMIEVFVKVSGEDTTLTQKHLIHTEGLSLSHEDPTLSGFVDQAVKAFGDGAKDVLIKIKYTW